MKKRIIFVINPISGGKEKKDFPDIARKHFDEKVHDVQYFFTKYKGHANAIAEKAVSDNEADVVVAVGGDGTINEVASALEGTKVAMGIVPRGSGNGLALSLKIPLDAGKALQTILGGRIIKIDTGVLNDMKFFNMAGLGFDAQISYKFADLKSRGLIGYIRTAFNEITTYKPSVYSLVIDDKSFSKKAFMISIANSSQYGNNAHIAPGALLNDGVLDVCIIKPFPLYLFSVLGIRMFTKTSDQSKYLEIIKGKNIRIKTERRNIVHLDGEPQLTEKEISILIKPSSLSVLY